MRFITRTSVVALLILLAVLLGLGFLTYSFIAPRGIFSGLPNDLRALQPDATVTYTDLEGNTIDIAKFKGTPLIVNSWATWIPFSQSELVLLGTVKGTYGDSVKVLAMNRMENIATIKSFLATYEIQSTNVLFLSDPIDNFYKAIGGYAMPETIFYDSDGIIVAHVRGVLSQSDLDENIRKILLKN